MSEPAPEPIVEPIEPTPQDPPAPETVERKAFDEVTSDLHKGKARIKELESTARDTEMKRLKANEEWQKAAEMSEERAVSAEGKLTKLSEGMNHNAKFSALEKAAMQAGIREQALPDLDMLDLETLTVERTSLGKTNVHGANDYIARLKASKPHWFKDPSAPNLNTDNPDVKVTHTGDVTIEAIHAASRKGDVVEYQRLHGEYIKQRNA